MAVSKNSMIGNAGEYFVGAELCKRNILALITPKNNPLFDIVASDPEGIRNVQIQVKTMATTNKQGWKLGVNMTKKRNNPRLFLVLVNMHDDKPNDYYIYKYEKESLLFLLFFIKPCCLKFAFMFCSPILPFTDSPFHSAVFPLIIFFLFQTHILVYSKARPVC